MRPSFYGRVWGPSKLSGGAYETCNPHLSELQAPRAPTRSCGSTSRVVAADDSSDASTLDGSMFSSTSSSGRGSRPSFYNRAGAANARRLWTSRAAQHRTLDIEEESQSLRIGSADTGRGATPPCSVRRSFYGRSRLKRQAPQQTTMECRSQAAIRIQSWCRGNRVRQRLDEYRLAKAVAEEARAAEVEARRLALEALRISAAVQIQRRYRSYSVEVAARQLALDASRHAASVQIQRRCRGIRARRLVVELLAARRAVEAEAAAKAAAVAAAAAKATAEGWLRLSGTRRWADSDPEDSDECEVGSATRTTSMASGGGGFVSATASTMGSDSPEGAGHRTDESNRDDVLRRVAPQWVSQQQQLSSGGGKSHRRRRKRKGGAKHWHGF